VLELGRAAADVFAAADVVTTAGGWPLDCVVDVLAVVGATADGGVLLTALTGSTDALAGLTAPELASAAGDAIVRWKAVGGVADAETVEAGRCD
jgi:hypothetical protein